MANRYVAMARRRRTSRKGGRGRAWRGRLLRVAAVGVVAAAALVGGYLGWLRDSGLVAVKDVEVRGASSADAGEIIEALERAARGMTTLHVREDELEQAVERFAVVASVSATASFPNRLEIVVSEHEPVATLASGGAGALVAGDGTVLDGVRVEGDRLPRIAIRARSDGRRIEGGRAMSAVRVAAAAPKELRGEVDRIAWTERGLVAVTRDGIKIVFGDAREAEVKWAAVIAVATDDGLAAVRAIDVRVPERPAVEGDLTPDAADDARRRAEEAVEPPAAAPAPAPPAAPEPAPGGPPAPADPGSGAAAPPPPAAQPPAEAPSGGASPE